MLYSMTGFGQAIKEMGNRMIRFEIRCLNSKQLDLKLRIPPNYREREVDIRRFLGNAIERGKVDIILEITHAHSQDVMINANLFKSYYRELSTIAHELGIQNTDWVSAICRFPNVVETQLVEPDEDEWNTVETLMQQGLAMFFEHRKTEAVPIEKEFFDRVGSILSLMERTNLYDKERVDKVRQRLSQNLEEIQKDIKIDENRLEQELIYYIEKFDFSEEKTRLRQHCDYFLEELKNDKERSKGKKLGFISQEMGREINTLGSKANSADIQKLVVQMKDELEKIKEQIANIL